MTITPDKSLTIKQYTIAGELFTKGFPAGGGPCTCSSACCEGGVFVDLHERDVIVAHKELIAAQMDGTQSTDPSTWFEEGEHEDDDFPSGRCVGTQVIHDKCAFLDGLGRCTIQLAAVNAGMDKWALKPLFCVLYPIEITNGTVSFDDMLQSEESCCTIGTSFEIPLFEGCREELVHLIGEEGFAAMRTHYQAMRTSGAHP
jgi:hypothetical protein